MGSHHSVKVKFQLSLSMIRSDIYSDLEIVLSWDLLKLLLVSGKTNQPTCGWQAVNSIV